MGRLLSVNVGIPRDIAWKGRTVHTAIRKDVTSGSRVSPERNEDEPHQVQASRRRWLRRGLSRGRACERTRAAIAARLPNLESHVSRSDSEAGRSLPSGRAGLAR